jgi:hypothetical protein
MSQYFGTRFKKVASSRFYLSRIALGLLAIRRREIIRQPWLRRAVRVPAGQRGGTTFRHDRLVVPRKMVRTG